MPQIYEVWNIDRYNAGLLPYKYSGSDYNDNPNYLGSSKHPEYKLHCKDANLIKYCLLSFNKEFVSPQQLRNFESLIQQKENHAGNPEYYNMTNYGQPDPSHPMTRKKISATNKLKGIQPNIIAINNAHNKQACQKRIDAMCGYKWFYNPTSLIRIKCLPINCPAGFIPGKCAKKTYPPKKTRDQICYNVQSWKIYKDGELFWQGDNLKEFCRNNDQLKYLYSSKNRTVTIKIYGEHIVYKKDDMIYLNDAPYGRSQKELAKLLGISESRISTAINTTNIVRYIKSESIYSATRV